MIIQNSNASDLVNAIISNAKDFPNRTACIFLGEDETTSVTYHELHVGAKRIGAYLADKISVGERLLLLYPPGLEFIKAFLGCLYAGVVAVPVHCPGPKEFKKAEAFLKVMLKDAEVSGILTIETIKPVIETQLGTFFLERKLVFLETTSISQDESMGKNFYFPERHTEDIAYLQYTSASTSNPKGVVFRHKHLNHTLKYSGEAWGYSRNSVALHWAPHSHVYGLLCSVLQPIYFGALAVLMPASVSVRQPLRWLSAITQYQATHSGAPNFGYELCADRIDQDECEGLDLSSWKVAVVTAEPVRYQTLTKFSEKFRLCGFSSKSFFPTYGMSETGAIASKPIGEIFRKFQVDAEGLKKNKAMSLSKVDNQGASRDFVASGKLLFDFNAKIVDPDSLIVKQEGEVGEIWLSGSSITDGYWKQDEENKKTFKATLENDDHFYFRTGDLGFIQDENIVISGRLKELIIVYGKNYYPLDLEVIAKDGHDSIKNRASAVFSLGEKDKVILVQEISNDMSLVDRGNIIKFVREAVSEKAGVDLYGIVLIREGTIPKTSSGKIQRKLCEKLYLEEKLDILQDHYKIHGEPNRIEYSESNIFEGQEEKSLLRKLQNDVIRIIAFSLKIEPKEIDLNDRITRYGIDSLSAAALISTLNKTYALRLRSTAMVEHESISLFCEDLFDQHKDNLRRYYTLMSEIETA